MGNDSVRPLRALLVAEGSGGHLIPALQVARTLAMSGAAVRLCYAQRSSLMVFTDRLAQEARAASVEVETVSAGSSTRFLTRLWHARRLWPETRRTLDTFAPDVVVGFGGLVSVPMILSAKARGIRCVLHEQNAVMGRANRWLAPWVDRVALSFNDPHATPRRDAWVTTGLPVRPEIGRISRAGAAAQFGLQPDRPTVFVLGGSQGSRVLNQMMIRMAARVSDEERGTWQFLHATGPTDAGPVKRAYATRGLAAWVVPFLAEMGAAYALADVVLARAGASTIAELARSGTSAILIPYPHAGGHQRENARVVEAIGGGFIIEEAEATPECLHHAIGCLLRETSVRTNMALRVRALDCADAAERLARLIRDVAEGGPRARRARGARTAWTPAYEKAHS